MRTADPRPHRPRTFALLWPVLALVALTLSGWAAAAAPAPSADSWPTLHRDNQRSGYTPTVIPGPYERKWFRDFHDEMIASRVEAIVAEGKVFVGTFAGNLHALNVTDGGTAWTFKAAGPIGHSPVYHNGRLYVGSEGERFDRGYVYCVSAADGREIWRTAVGAGVWVAPACDGRAIYFGDRGGAFHAVSIADGRVLWSYQTGAMILTPASISEDGRRIVFASEDMHAYCVDPSGKLLWKSAKLGGLSMRDYAPTIWKGLAIVRTNPAISFHDALGMRGSKVLGETQKAIPLTDEDQVIRDQWGTYALKYTERRMAAERKAISEYLARHPEERTFFALNLDDGTEPWVAPVPYNGGLHNPGAPPTFNPDTGELYFWSGSALSNYSAGVPGGCQVLGKLDRESGLVEIVWHRNLQNGRESLGWASVFAAPADETQALSLMGNVILNTHQGIIGGLNLETLRWHPAIYSARDSYGGIFGVAYNPTPRGMEGGFYAGTYAGHNAGNLTMVPNEWHGPARGVVAIGEGRFFWVVGSQVVCLGGPSAAATASGGTSPPPAIRRRTPGVAGGANLVFSVSPPPDPALQPRPLTVADVRAIAQTPPAAPGALAAELRPRLDAAVIELIDGGPWAPLVIELGMHNERHFWRTADTMQIVAQALPLLSPAVQARARTYLDGMFEAGAPLSAATHPARSALRREHYELGDGALRRTAEANPTYSAGIADLYALWAYAHYAGAWDKVAARADQVQQVFASARPPGAPARGGRGGGSGAGELNEHIAGTIAYIRIMNHVGRAADAQAALERLAALATQRVHLERTDRRIVVGGHRADVPRYSGLVPEIGALLAAHAREELTRNVRDMMIDLPVWYQAFSERLIGGENYTSPPVLARGLFAAAAYGLNAPAAELARYLDQPWCKADLYYIEKLTATMRAP